MKKINLLFAAAALTFCFGCGGDITVEPQPTLPPLPPAPAPVTVTTQADANFTVASETNTKLRADFKWNNSEANFSCKLAERLADQIVIQNADLTLNGKCDVTIIIMPEFELKDKTGNYYRINCNQIKVSLVMAQKTGAIKVIELKPMPRKLGIEQAKNQYLDPAVKKLVPFLRKELTRLSNEEVAVGIVNFALANIQEQPSSEKVAKEVERIADIMKNMNGIINYTVIRQDVNKAQCTYRVVYLREKFPQGLRNALNLKLANK